MKKTKNALVLFVKNIQPFKVKTRLANSIGEKKAHEVYRALLTRTFRASKEARSEKHIFYSDFIENQTDFDAELHVQEKGTDLGGKMLDSFNKLFDLNYDSIVLIGSDCPDINSSILNKAFEELRISDAVIGPAEDGGFYLIGINSNQREHLASLFLNRKWSHPNVLDELKSSLNAKAISYSTLEKLMDIDVVDDLIQYNKKGNGNPLPF